MYPLFKKYKSVIRFVVLFLSTYIVLSMSYMLFLSSTDTTNKPDLITNLVATQTSFLLDQVGYNAEVVASTSSPQMKLIVSDHYIANIVEGCNGISIIILFVAFVIAFAEKFKKTSLFLLAGIALIYVINIIRIAILAIAISKYPSYQSILHGVVFPGIIYGMVFLLWMFWVRSLKAKL
ncbi:MAG: exosortase family protein XrtF [Patiriisocius sp.]|jgi:exosortase family protein XrtF